MPVGSEHGRLGVCRYERGQEYLSSWLRLVLVGIPLSLVVWLIFFLGDVSVLLVIMSTGIIVVSIAFASHRYARHAAVELDFDNECIRLYRFRYPLSFMDVRRKEQVTIEFDELRGIERLSGNGNTSAVVHTSRSRFMLNETIGSFEQLVAQIRSVTPAGASIPLNKRFRFVCLAVFPLGIGLPFLIAWLIGWI